MNSTCTRGYMHVRYAAARAHANADPRSFSPDELEQWLRSLYIPACVTSSFKENGVCGKDVDDWIVTGNTGVVGECEASPGQLAKLKRNWKEALAAFEAETRQEALGGEVKAEEPRG